MSKRRKWEAGFLAALSLTASVTAACAKSGADQSEVYQYRKANPEFARQWQVALNQAVDALELEARRRALVGVKQKKFTKDGKPIIDPETTQQYVEHAYSDQLLIFLLKAHRPKKYRERKAVEHSGRIDSNVVVKHDLQARRKRVKLELHRLFGRAGTG